MTTTAPAVLAVNVGSSSLKCALFTHDADPRPIARETLDGVTSSCLPRLLDWIDRQEQHVALVAIGHRIVHGGSAFREPQPVTSDVLGTLRQLIPFAPNHLPDEIALIEALEHHRPAVPQIACVDTAFHADPPDVVRRLPIPDTQASADHLEDLLSHRAGLLGISGESGDMRTLLAREMTDSRCRLAVAAYVYGVRKAIGALAAALGGLDTLVFFGGIGEHAPTVRSRICDRLEFLGAQIDSDRNCSNAPVISAAAAHVVARVIPTDEELMIARATCRLVA